MDEDGSCQGTHFAILLDGGIDTENYIGTGIEADTYTNNNIRTLTVDFFLDSEPASGISTLG
jgi:hypothetical protein